MRVLVCDDDPEVGGFLQTLFGMEGWTTDLVASGEECLTHLEAEQAPDVLVLDQVMPGLTGIGTAQQLRSDGFRAPIILCSGHLGPELNDEIARLELIPINKIDLQALVRVVQVAVRSARLAHAKAPAKKAPGAKAPARKRAATKAPAKKAAAKKAPAKNAAAKQDDQPSG